MADPIQRASQWLAALALGASRTAATAARQGLGGSPEGRWRAAAGRVDWGRARTVHAACTGTLERLAGTRCDHPEAAPGSSMHAAMYGPMYLYLYINMDASVRAPSACMYEACRTHQLLILRAGGLAAKYLRGTRRWARVWRPVFSLLALPASERAAMSSADEG
ncbi:hypothetical protein TARUN_661 [Trichoderma arundinaceum]|uniref:Uncharacterized protein n=1 Tax=Trichoderma arundinaceum TaxID=490622 RepID=A0A395NZI9_TRIAR|nr:hypothetical protein TARUN_661 [Trichoderma arundinaceum]